MVLSFRVQKVIIMAYCMIGITVAGFGQFAGGDGTEDSPYQIENIAHFFSVRYYLNSHFIQTADIDLHSPWTAVGDENDPFTGTYDGGLFSIRGLTINSNNSRQGLFGYIDGAVLKRMILLDVNVTGESFSGVLAGHAENSNLENIRVTGNFTGNGHRTGGLVGHFGNGQISYCSFSGNIDGGGVTQATGGLIGTFVNGSMSHSYSEVRISGGRDHIGGLIGAASGVEIEHCRSEVYMRYEFPGAWQVGGLLGRGLSSSINHSYAEGELIITGPGTREVGGLAGFGDGLRITNCHSHVDVNTYRMSTGGLAGWLRGLINNSFSTGTVIGTDDTGGLAGYFIGTINESYASGSVQGRRYVGGLVGQMAGNINFSYSENEVRGTRCVGGIAGLSEGNVLNSYSVGLISGAEITGGLVGQNSGNVFYSYSTSKVNGLHRTSGLIGLNEGYVADSFWNLQTSNHDESDGGVGLSTRQLIREGTFTDANWDFDIFWSIDEAVSYPYHQWQTGPLLHNKPGPYNLNVTGCEVDMEITLTWEIIGEAARFDIYRNDEIIDTVLHLEREWTDRNFEMNVKYHYHIRAWFDMGEEDILSFPSNTASIIFMGGFAGGLGTAESPYRVATAFQLNNIRYFLDGHFVQIADIDLNTAPYNVGSGWQSIGYSAEGNRFTGFYDGGGYEIRGLIIDNPDSHQGLFGDVEDATIINVSLTGVNVNFGTYSGSLTGRIYNTTIRDCFVSGTIEGTGEYVGGLLGVSNHSTVSGCSVEGSYRAVTNSLGGLAGFTHATTIENCWTNVEMQAQGSYSGGLVGRAGPLTRIIKCYSLGNISNVPSASSRYMGGLIGWSEGVFMEDSYAIGNVTSSERNDFIGGLIGGFSFVFVFEDTEFYVKRSYAYGNVTGGNYVGGLIGRATILNQAVSFKIEDSYAKGSVEGYEKIGGLVGYKAQNVIVDRCFSIGRVEGFNDLGGLIGESTGVTIDSYWDMQTSQTENSAGGQGRSTEQMQYPFDDTTYLNWDFENVWSIDTTGYSNSGYPYLRWQKSPYPNQAENPIPTDGGEGISVLIDALQWSYFHDSLFEHPIGFKVYFGTDKGFGDEDGFEWVEYIEGEENYLCSSILPNELEYNTTYYWKVVPTTIEPERRGSDGERERRLQLLASLRSRNRIRGDAKNVPVWSFKTETFTSVEESSPYITKLYGNFPNPFNPETTISFSLAETGEVLLEIFNIKGQKIATLSNSVLTAGHHQAVWNGRDDKNNPVSSGVYYYRLKTGDIESVNKMILLK